MHTPPVPRSSAVAHRPGPGPIALLRHRPDDPHVTAPEQRRYDACVEVPESFVAHSPAGITVLPGGRYAVADFRGTGPQISLAWTEMLRDWLPASGMQADGRPFFEYYPVNTYSDAATGAFACQICLPVRPL